jgi:phosphoglucomutase
MEGYRNNPPEKIGGSKVVRINDYLTRLSTDTATGKKNPLLLPKSDVLQFFLADGTKISVRPSGTEPKIKFYFSTNTGLKNTSEFETVWKSLDARIDEIIKDMRL